MKLISGCEQLFHKTFVESYFERLKDVVETKLLNAPEQQLKDTRFDKIEETVEMVWLKLMKRKVNETEVKNGKYQLLTKLGLIFLRQSFITKRIDGAMAIDQVCKSELNKNNSSSDGDTASVLLKTLQDHDVIDLFFKKKNIHD